MHGRKKTQAIDLVLGEGGSVEKPRRQKPETASTSWYYFGIVGQIGFSIALPIAGGAIGGSFVDRYFATYPRWTLGLLGLGVAVSFLTFYQTIRTLLQRK